MAINIGSTFPFQAPYIFMNNDPNSGIDNRKMMIHFIFET